MELIELFESGGRWSLCYHGNEQSFEAIFIDYDRCVAEFLHDLLCIIISKEHGLGDAAALSRCLGPEEASTVAAFCPLPIVTAVAACFKVV
jgi:hypothetical protein